MTKPNVQQNPSWFRTLRTGATTGIVVTSVYAALFALYAILRTSATIAASIPFNMLLLGTLVANAMSIAIVSMAMATLLSVFTACLGMGTAATIRGLDALFNPSKSLQRTMLIGLAATLAIVLIVDFGAQTLLQRSLNSLGVETYLFWFGFPALLHIGAGLLGAWYLHRIDVKNPAI